MGKRVPSNKKGEFCYPCPVVFVYVLYQGPIALISLTFLYNSFPPLL